MTTNFGVVCKHRMTAGGGGFLVGLGMAIKKGLSSRALTSINLLPKMSISYPWDQNGYPMANWNTGFRQTPGTNQPSFRGL